MKNYIILFLLFSIIQSAGFCWTYTSYDKQTLRPYKVTNVGKITPYQARQLQILHRQRQINKARKLNNLRRTLNNFKYGTMTGYSVPINANVYNQMRITPYNYDSLIKPNSNNLKSNIFSNQQGNEIYFDDGRYYKNSSGTNGKAGVTILYD